MSSLLASSQLPTVDKKRKLSQKGLDLEGKQLLVKTKGHKKFKFQKAAVSLPSFSSYAPTTWAVATQHKYMTVDSLFLVFSWLLPQDLVKCRRVSRFWCNTASHNTLWQPLFLRYFDSPLPRPSNLIQERMSNDTSPEQENSTEDSEDDDEFETNFDSLRRWMRKQEKSACSKEGKPRKGVIAAKAKGDLMVLESAWRQLCDDDTFLTMEEAIASLSDDIQRVFNRNSSGWFFAFLEVVKEFPRIIGVEAPETEGEGANGSAFTIKSEYVHFSIVCEESMVTRWTHLLCAVLSFISSEQYVPNVLRDQVRLGFPTDKSCFDCVPLSKVAYSILRGDFSNFWKRHMQAFPSDIDLAHTLSDGLLYFGIGPNTDTTVFTPFVYPNRFVGERIVSTTRDRLYKRHFRKMGINTLKEKLCGYGWKNSGKLHNDWDEFLDEDDKEAWAPRFFNASHNWFSYQRFVFTGYTPKDGKISVTKQFESLSSF